MFWRGFLWRHGSDEFTCFGVWPEMTAGSGIHRIHCSGRHNEHWCFSLTLTDRPFLFFSFLFLDIFIHLFLSFEEFCLALIIRSPRLLFFGIMGRLAAALLLLSLLKGNFHLLTYWTRVALKSRLNLFMKWKFVQISIDIWTNYIYIYYISYTALYILFSYFICF